MPEKYQFNSVIALDLIKSEDKTVLQIVDTQTNFTDAKGLYSETLNSPW